MSWSNSPISFTNFALWSALKILCVFAVLMFIVAYAVWVERKVSAAIQDRRGPNRVGWFGLLQPVADGVKSFLKEDFTPAHVRKAYYWLAPAIVMIPSLLTVAIIPFGSKIGRQSMVIADLNVGILYTFGIVSLGVYGIVLAGYAANSKYPFLGGWTLPFAGLDQPAATAWVGVLHIGIFLAKMLFVVFMIIWVRWMWPRFRYDQLMDLGWRRFIPLSLANIILTAVVLWAQS